MAQTIKHDGGDSDAAGDDFLDPVGEVHLGQPLATTVMMSAPMIESLSFLLKVAGLTTRNRRRPHGVFRARRGWIRRASA